MDQVTLFHRILHKIVQKYTKSLFGGIFYIYRKFLNCVKKNSLNIKDLKIENSKVVSPNTVSPNTETPNTSRNSIRPVVRRNLELSKQKRGSLARKRQISLNINC